MCVCGRVCVRMCMRVRACVCVHVCVCMYMQDYLKPLSCNVGLKEVRSKKHRDSFDNGLKNICLQKWISITFLHLMTKHNVYNTLRLNISTTSEHHSLWKCLAKSSQTIPT